MSLQAEAKQWYISLGKSIPEINSIEYQTMISSWLAYSCDLADRTRLAKVHGKSTVKMPTANEKKTVPNRRTISFGSRPIELHRIKNIMGCKITLPFSSSYSENPKKIEE